MSAIPSASRPHPPTGVKKRANEYRLWTHFVIASTDPSFAKIDIFTVVATIALTTKFESVWFASYYGKLHNMATDGIKAS